MPVMLIVSIVMLVASFALSAIMMKKNRQKPAALEDWEFSQGDEGTEQVVIFGDAWSSPFVLWWGNYRTKKIKAQGKK